MSAAKGKQWALLVPCLLVLVTLSPLCLLSEARTTKEFSDGQKEVDFEFPTGTESYIVNVTIPRSAKLSSAQVGVTGLPLGSVMTYPRSPSVDMGNDGSIDWTFSGQGYGSFGRQQVLSDNSPSGKVVLHGAGNNSSLVLRLPADAKVVTASLRVTGQPHADDWWNQSWLYRIPVQVKNDKAVALGEIVADLWVATSNFTIRDTNEFRVFYKPSDAGPIEERPSQVVDTRKISGLIMEGRIIFKTKPLAAGETQHYDVYFGNANPPTPPMLTEFRPNDIRNRPEVPNYENVSEVAPGYFNKPVFAAFDGTNLYVTDTAHHAVRVFDAFGALKGTLGTYGSAGSGTTHLNSPSGVAVGPDGKIYVSDTLNDRVQVYLPDLQYSSSITDGAYVFLNGDTNLSSPHGIRVLSNGTIMLADTGNHIIQRFKPDGSLLDFIGSPGWTGNDNDHFNSPYDVCVEEDGSVLVADWNNNRVQMFSPSLSYSATLGSMGSAMGQFLFPSGIECKDGSVYVADTANHRVQVFSGTPLVWKRQYGQTASSGPGVDQFNQPTSVVVDSRGILHIADSGNNRVVRILGIAVNTSNAEYIYPKSPNMDIGADGLAEWSYSGMLVGPMTTGEIKVRLNVAIFSATPMTDSMGNRYVDLPIVLASKGQGAMTIDQIDIHYETLAILNATSVVRDRLDQADPNAPTVSVPFKVSAQSGKVRLSNISIVYDMPPTIIGLIPSTYSIDEDTSNAKLIDLFSYFKDDIDQKENLTFGIINSTNSTHAKVAIDSGHFISLDSINRTDTASWHGTVQITVSCTNTRGLTTQFGPFTVTVRHVNHRPMFVSSPVMTATEGENYTYQVSAQDKDGDMLTYSLVFCPKGMTINATTGLVRWTPDGYQTGNQPVEVLSDDGDMLTGKARQVFNITVKNVNDPPVIKSKAYTEATVGEEYGYTVIAEDEDDDNLTFSLSKAPKGMKIDPLSGTISWKPAPGQEGRQSVSVVVNDGSVTDKQDFNIEVKSNGMVAGIPMMYLFIGIGLLLIILIGVAVAVTARRKSKTKRPARARKDMSRRTGRTTIEEKLEDTEGTSSSEGPYEDHNEAEPEECPKCGDLIEHGIGYCSSCGHVVKRDGDDKVSRTNEKGQGQTTTKVITEDDPGPQRSIVLPKYEAKDDAVDVSAGDVIVVEKDHPPQETVEAPDEQEAPDAVEPDEEGSQDADKDVEKEKKDDRSLDDILNALKD